MTIPRIKWLPAWLESREKWQETIWRTERGEKFVDFSGFEKLKVVISCGYCHTFMVSDDNSWNNDCTNCPLFIRNLCIDSVIKTDFERFAFWKYVHLMRIGENKAALPYALKVLKGIEQEP